MLETPESFKYGFNRKNLENWAISRQLLKLSGKPSETVRRTPKQ
jgi:hypothetical protein